jgi:hypothetical protein
MRLSFLIKLGNLAEIALFFFEYIKVLPFEISTYEK